MTGRIHIGTSGWHYDHWIGPFYPKGTRKEELLAWYATRFQTVEINNTFYHLPTRKTMVDWRQGTPKDFLFACKASRFITHMKKLKDPSRTIKRFFQVVETLEPKLGPVLFQLPPRWHINLERLDHLLKVLPKKYRYAFEFRDESWWTSDTYDLLARYNAAFCMYHLAGRQSPREVTADFVYIRLHGPDGPYQGYYDPKELRVWAKHVRNWSQVGKDVYCYFDNDQCGYAAKDALQLKTLIAHHKARRRS